MLTICLFHCNFSNTDDNRIGAPYLCRDISIFVFDDALFSEHMNFSMKTKQKGETLSEIS